MPPSIDSRAVRDALTRLAARGAQALNANMPPHWGDAILCDGLLYAARALRTQAPAEQAIKWFGPRLANGPDTSGWFWMWAAEALTALDLHVHTRRAEYLDYARAVLDAIEHKTQRTADGAIVPHPPALEVWVDATYFVAPAMALYGRLMKDDAMMAAALAQLMAHLNHLFDAVTGLLWHVAYPETKTHSPCLWARGNSWFSIAASQVLGEIRAAGMDSRLRKTGDVAFELARQLGAVTSMQDSENGLWHTVLERPDSYLEASATAGFALALGRALRLDLERLSAFRTRNSYAMAIGAVLTRIDEKGEFTGVSQQTPPGDFHHYQSIEVGTAPFGTGVCLMALAEALEYPI